MVNLTRIYTRTGDTGQTMLAGNQPVTKTDPRLAAVGAVDEANSAIGVALTLRPKEDVVTCLSAVQNELFDLGADLATPLPDDPGVRTLRIEEQAVVRLETWCDRFGGTLPALQSFLLPGGTPLSAQLHLARAVVRRAELAAWVAAETFELNPLALRYLNRLSDLLFVLARHCARQDGAQETLWTPGRPISAEHGPR